MAGFNSEKYIVYESEYGVPPAEQEFIHEWENTSLTLGDSHLPSMTYAGYIFLGWSYNGELVKAGDTITLGSYDLIFTAVWQKETTYVMVDKDDLVSIADTVRNLSGSTEKFNVSDLVVNTVNALETGGGSEEATYDCEVVFNLPASVASAFDAYSTSESIYRYGFALPYGITSDFVADLQLLFKRGSLLYFYSTDYTKAAVSDIATTGDIEIIDAGDSFKPTVLKINGNGTATLTK